MPCRLVLRQRKTLPFSFAARPSGTEPKIKFYFFARARVSPPAVAPETPESTPPQKSLAEVKLQAETKLGEFQDALSAWVHNIWAT